MWVGMIDAIKVLNIAENIKLYLPVAVGWYLLTGRDFRDLTEHHDSEAREGRSTVFFVLLAESKNICLLNFPASEIYVRYPVAEKQELTELLRIADVFTPTYSAFVGDEYPHYTVEDVTAGLLQSTLPHVHHHFEL